MTNNGNQSVNCLCTHRLCFWVTNNTCTSSVGIPYLLLFSVNDSHGLQRSTFLTMWPTIRIAWTDASALGISRLCFSEVKHSLGRGRSQSGKWAQPQSWHSSSLLLLWPGGAALPWARNANESQKRTYP